MGSIMRRARASGVAVLALLAVGGGLASASTARAATDTWAGGQPLGGATVGDWSQAANWSAPVASGDALSFPDLPGCNAASDACYGSTDTVGTLSVPSLTIADDAPYDVSGGPGSTVTLGPNAGGAALSAQPMGGTAGGGLSRFWVPILVNGSQNWSVTGPGALSVGFVSAASTATPSAINLALAGGADFYFNNSVNVSGVNVTGSGLVDFQGDVDGDQTGDGPITVNGPSLVLGSIVGGVVKVGQLKAAGGAVTVGSSSSQSPSAVQVQGPLDLSGATSTTIVLKDTGMSPGVDYGQLAATGTAAIGGQLALAAESATGSCPSPAIGSTDTFITATAGLSGQFSNLPNGSITQLAISCGGGVQHYPVRINYTGNSVTGTFVAPAATSVGLAASATHAIVGAAVTFNATVTPGAVQGGMPSGSVQFLDGSTPLACTSPLNGASPDVASCTTTALPAGTQTITAVYGGDGAYAGSTSAPVSVLVGAAGSTTGTSGSGSGAAHAVTLACRPSIAAASEHGRIVRVTVKTAGATGCELTARLLVSEAVRHGKRTVHRLVSIGSAKIRAKPHARRTLDVTIDAAGRRMLARAGVLHIHVALQGTQHGKALTVATRSLALHPTR